MKRITYILMTLLTIILGSSCENQEWPAANKADQNGFTLEYKIAKPISAITRAAIQPEQGEDNINSLYILFFENNSGGNGLFVEAMEINQNADAPLGTSGRLDISFPENSLLSNSVEYKMLFCANMEEYVTLPLQSAEDIKEHFQGYTENEVISTLLQISGVPTNLDPIAEQENNSNLMSISDLPMSASGVKTANETSISIELTRAVSRFDVFCQASGYELVSVSVWNALTVTPLWEGLHRDFSEDRTERYYGVGVNEDKQIVGSLYAFENYVTAPQQSDTKTTCLIIGLKKEGKDGVKYFRANINETNNGQQLKRNNVYRTTVKEVIGQGEDDERSAYQSAELKLEIDINGWSIDDSGNFYHDGENMLALPTKLINLSPFGETRTYNVFTLGEGNLEISDKKLPSHITAELKGNLLIVKAEASSEPIEGSIEIQFGFLKGSIAISQQPYDSDFLDLSDYELPTFSSAAGHVSSDINVYSSGPWTAEIYQSDYFSFSARTQVTTINGVHGESFNLQTIQANTNENVRYSFILVKLTEKPEISRVIVLGQAGTKSFYLTVTPDHFATISAGGGYTENILVHASGRFTATLSLETSVGEVVFVDAQQDIDNDDENEDEDENEKNEKEYGVKWDSRANGNTFAVRFSALTTRNTPARAILTVYLNDDNSVRETFIIDQEALSPYNLVVQTRNYAKAGSLFNMKKSATYRYVYNLASNMRDTNLFGFNGTITETEGYVFSSGTKIDETTNIFQLTGKLTTAQGKALKTWMNGSDSRFTFVTHNAGYASTSATRLNTYFGTNYKVIDPNIAAKSSRYLVEGTTFNNKVIAYLLNGPFGRVDPVNIDFNGKSIQNRGLTQWPNTFVPIIMGISETAATRGQEVCLFGIDPVMRIIWITDPAIFGSQKTADANSQIYPAGSDHERFLNNFIAWLTHAATKGEDFLKDFK